MIVTIKLDLHPMVGVTQISEENLIKLWVEQYLSDGIHQVDIAEDVVAGEVEVISIREVRIE
jgi:hypothetical protein